LDWSAIQSWDALEKAIGQLQTQQDRGEAFEEFCAALLELHKDYYQAKAIWRFRDVPDEILNRLGSSNRQDVGIDGVLLHYDDTLTAYQSKFRLHRSDIPSQRELSTFYMVSDRADFRLIISNVEDLPRVARERKAHGQCLVDALLNLSEGFFASLQEYVLHQKQKIEPPPEPRLFQQQAIEAVVNGFKEHCRGQAILPCGSGKTLIGKWIVDRLRARRILIMVPSLALIKQTLDEWHRVRGSGFRYLCVCSDQSVASLHSADGWETDPSEQDLRVSTDSRELVAFLRQPTSLPQVVLSTYQSSPVLITAMRELATDDLRFDLAICDEAHKVAGAAGKPFAQILSDGNIPADKRLFMTATPRVVAPQYRRTTEEDQTPIVSMDEEEIFGPVFYRMSFAEAIQQKIIADYRVVVIGVSEKEVAELARAQRTIETEDQEQWDAQGLAQRIALGKAIGLYGIKKIFSFHNRVNNASDFVDANRPDSLPAVLDKMTPNLHYMAKHINGQMSAGERSRVLREFQMSVRGVVSNARCLGEGVNVPVVDGVFFAESRSSVIDIVQATGRALRNAPGKSMAYVIIPVLVQEEEDPEAILEASRFELVWQVLSAMVSQDERVEGAIREARIRQGEGRAPVLGQTHGFDQQDLPDANAFLIGFPKHIAFSEYQKLFSLEMMEQFGARWHLRFGALKKYMEEHGREPEKDTEYAGIKIGAWLEAQRAAYRRGKLPDDREELLDQLGVQWGSYRDTERSWIHHMVACSKFFEETGGLPTQEDESPEGLKIGVWLSHQRKRFRKGILREDRKQALLELLGDVLDPRQNRWERNFAALRDFMEKTGKQPQNRTIHNGVAIGNWLSNTKRPNKIKLTSDQVSQLEALGISFVPTPERTRSSNWDRNFAALKEFVKSKGKLPSKYERWYSVNVGSWLAEKIVPQRNKLTPEQVSELEALGVSFVIESTESKSADQAILKKNRSFDVSPPQDRWFEYYHLSCEYLSWLQASMRSNDFHKGKYIGEWFFREQRLYNEMLLSTGKSLLYKILLRLQKSRGWSARRWWHMYALCSELILISPHALTEEVTYCDERIGKWYEEQMSLFKQEQLEMEQQEAMKELIRLSGEKSNYKI
jgi:superfamily II DNA or RNA helicase